ncbi:MAG: helix-turn-helix domain-containing protein [Candidatus Nanoarchaeia archaeon]|nr:helix-turn-helix domain-containing protein [Candidatus Nanoarchaeia archaeon]
MDIPELERIGLSKNDRKVYLSLLESNSVSVSNLVKKIGFHRSYIHDILNKLINMGLVSITIKNNKKIFNAENPEKIIDILKTKKEQIQNDEEKLSKILPLLIEKKKFVSEEPEARIFIGKEGIKSILEDVLFQKKDFVAFGAEGKFKEIYQWYFNNWQKRRVETKLHYKVIYNNKLKKIRPTKDQKLVDIRFLPEKYEFPATTIVYKNKVAILLWDANPIGFVIENEDIAKSFNNYFEILWSTAKS